MAHKASLNDELAELERALKGLPLRGARTHRDRLLYLAGRESVARNTAATKQKQRRLLRLWQTTTAAMTLVAVGLSMMLLNRPEPEPDVAAPPVVQNDNPSPENPPMPSAARHEPRVRADRQPPEPQSSPPDEPPRDTQQNRLARLAPPEYGPNRQSGPRFISTASASLDEPLNYLQLRNRILMAGLDAWPAESVKPNLTPGERIDPAERIDKRPMTYGELRRHLLENGTFQ